MIVLVKRTKKERERELIENERERERAGELGRAEEEKEQMV
jgi:hypothetical protein